VAEQHIARSRRRMAPRPDLSALLLLLLAGSSAAYNDYEVVLHCVSCDFKSKAGTPTRLSSSNAQAARSTSRIQAARRPPVTVTANTMSTSATTTLSRPFVSAGMDWRPAISARTGARSTVVVAAVAAADILRKGTAGMYMWSQEKRCVYLASWRGPEQCCHQAVRIHDWSLTWVWRFNYVQAK
jgi:hypothetical protein